MLVSKLFESVCHVGALNDKRKALGSPLPQKPITNRNSKLSVTSAVICDSLCPSCPPSSGPSFQKPLPPLTLKQGLSELPLVPLTAEDGPLALGWENLSLESGTSYLRVLEAKPQGLNLKGGGSHIYMGEGA